MLLNFPSYWKNNISKNEYSLLEELRATQSHKPKGKPPLSDDSIRYALHPRYTPFTSWHDNMNADAFPGTQKKFYVKMLFQDSKSASVVSRP